MGMGLLTEHQTESLLRTERRAITAADGRRVECEAPALVWNAFDELVRPPIGLCRFEIIGRALGISDERGEPFAAGFEAVVETFHSGLAPPWSLRLMPRRRAQRS